MEMCDSKIYNLFVAITDGKIQYVNKKASRFKGGGLVTFYLIKDRPQPAKVNWTVFYYAQNVKIKVSNATT